MNLGLDWLTIYRLFCIESFLLDYWLLRIIDDLGQVLFHCINCGR